LFYFGAGLDTAPVRLGVYSSDSTWHIREEFKEKGGNPKVLELLDSVDRFVFSDVVWSPTNRYLFPTLSHFVHWHQVNMDFHMWGKFKHDKRNKVMIWDFGNKSLEYFYGVDMFNDISRRKTPLLHERLQEADVVYQHGMFPESDPENVKVLADLTPKAQYAIHHFMIPEDGKSKMDMEDMCGDFYTESDTFRLWEECAMKHNPNIEFIRTPHFTKTPWD
jgi:hypothetical protein